MKAFAFRLEQALRWRETQVNLQKARLAAAAGRLAEIEARLNAQHRELSEAAAQVAGGIAGIGFNSYAGFRRLSREHMRELETQAQTARGRVREETDRLVEANRNLRVLENLKRDAQGRWRLEFDRELAAFADETFLQALRFKAPRRGT